MAYFDLVEITLFYRGISFLFAFFIFIFSEKYPLWEKWSFKNLCDSIYGMEMKTAEKKSSEHCQGDIHKKKRQIFVVKYLEGNIFSNIMHFLFFWVLLEIFCDVYSWKSLAFILIL